MFKNIPDSFTETVLCSISEPALIFDSDIRVIWANPSAELFFGHSSEFMAEKKCMELFGGVLECFDNCPVKKALTTGTDEVLVVDGVVCPHKLIEAIPYSRGRETLILAIVHSVPEVDRNKALRRDFAARMNLSVTLEEAAPDIVNAIKSLTSVPTCGIYVKQNDQFDLLYGGGVPNAIPCRSSEFDFSSPLYLPSDRLPFTSDDEFPDGAAIVPVAAPGGETGVLLLAGRGTMSTTARNRLEMIASVLGSCIIRLTSAPAS